MSEVLRVLAQHNIHEVTDTEAIDALDNLEINNIIRQRNTLPGLIEVNAFQVVSNELFIEAFLVLTGFILICRPEPRRIRRKNLID